MEVLTKTSSRSTGPTETPLLLTLEVWHCRCMTWKQVQPQEERIISVQQQVVIRYLPRVCYFEETKLSWFRNGSVQLRHIQLVMIRFLNVQSLISLLHKTKNIPILHYQIWIGVG